jgi:hypothetical protein
MRQNPDADWLNNDWHHSDGPVQSSQLREPLHSGHRQCSAALQGSCLANSQTIEPRVPIGELGFTEGYALLDVGENVQERVSMHPRSV